MCGCSTPKDKANSRDLSEIKSSAKSKLKELKQWDDSLTAIQEGIHKKMDALLEKQESLMRTIHSIADVHKRYILNCSLDGEFTKISSDADSLSKLGDKVLEEQYKVSATVSMIHEIIPPHVLMPDDVE